MSAVRSFRSTRFGSPGIAPLSLGIPTAVYPGRIATNSDLIVAVDGQQTGLLLPMGPTDVSMTVVDASQIVAYNLLSIDNEIVKTTGAPAGNVVPISRGFDGTAPASHSANAIVSGLVDAWHHNALVSEIEAIETALGPNLTNVAPFSGWYNMSRYNFAPRVSGSGVTAPGGVLNPGNNVLTFAVVPIGVNGTDIQHYLYISGGTGAPEACLINGGGGTAGQLNGQILINCANAHSGAWSVSTATSGFQEAKVAAGPNSVIFMPGGSWPFYAPAYIDTYLQVIGAGINSTVIVPQTLSQDVFDVVTPNPGGGQIPVIFRDFMITTLGTRTAGSMISITGAAGSFNAFSEISNVWFESPYVGINLTNADCFTIADCKFHSGSAVNTYIFTANPAHTDAGDSIIQRNWFLAGGVAIDSRSGGGLRIMDNKFLACATPINVNWAGAVSNQIAIHSNLFDQPGTNGIVLTGDSGTSMADVSIAGNFIGGLPTDSLIKINGNGGLITRVVIASNNLSIVGGSGTVFNIIAGVEIQISGNEVLTGIAGATVISAAPGTIGFFTGNLVAAFQNAGFNVAGSGFYFASNEGIDNVVASLLASSTFTLPIQPNFVIQGGPGTITGIVPPTAVSGLRGTFITAGVLTFTAGATIGQSGTTTANKLYQWMWDGAKLWITGPGF